MSLIPYGRQSIDEEDIASVVEVLRSPFLTQGPKIAEFEAAIAGIVGSQHAVAVNSGTSALHLACMALGLGAGDRLWTSPVSFVASANCGRYCGADVDFIDIDSHTLNIDVKVLEKKLQAARQTGQLPKIVVAVHFAGLPCDMAELKRLSDEYSFYIIEDAAHALGAQYGQSRIGDCQYSHMCTFSFHPIKSITTGEGGMVTTNVQEWADKITHLRTHGIVKVLDETQSPDQGDWYYEQIDLGYNYRMTDIQATLGLSQCQRLDSFISKRSVIAQRYDEKLAELPLTLAPRGEGRTSAWHLYPIQLDDAGQRKKVFDTLREHEIWVQVHYIPIHLQPYYRQLGFEAGDFPVSEQYYSKTISLPIFPDLSEQEQDRVVSVLGAALQ